MYLKGMCFKYDQLQLSLLFEINFLAIVNVNSKTLETVDKIKEILIVVTIY